MIANEGEIFKFQYKYTPFVKIYAVCINTEKMIKKIYI